MDHRYSRTSSRHTSSGRNGPSHNPYHQAQEHPQQQTRPQQQHQQLQPEIDFSLFQQELDAAFHSRADPFPAGSPEHGELLQFVTKLHKVKRSRLPDGTDVAPNAAATALGLPAAYDPRFRVNCTLAAPGPGQQQLYASRLRGAAAAVDRRISQLAASGRAGGSQLAHLSGEQVVSEYRSLLPWWEDFFQRRQLARVRKLQQDRAALPAASHQQAIVDALRGHQALVVAGDTGCGKSTQVPQFLAAAGWRRVAVTQPRRISAVSLARRVAVELCDAHGTSVAHQVRFSSSAAGDSRIVFMTEGILLRLLAADPRLEQYDVVVLDEVHERHLTTDFLLALLRALLLQRPEMRLVLMSATINCRAFSDYYGGAPIITIPGRLYPIQLVYLPPPAAQGQGLGLGGGQAEGDRRDRQRRGGGGGAGGSGRGGPQQDAIDPGPYLKLLQRIDSEVPASQRGDLLVFVAGAADIQALCDALAPYAQQTRRWVLLPLHAGLPLDQQDKVFDVAPEGVRKAIVATNIAETSLTIDGVRFVADSGRAKEMIHDVASGGGSLQEGWISRASADQRKGRAGRTGPGLCYRMYSEAQFNEMRAFSSPEVARVRLEAVVLSIKALAGSSMDPRTFGFIDPPPPDRLEGAIRTLQQVGALTCHEALTPLGAVLSLLPVDVAVGKLLVMGCVFGMAGPALTLAAALSVQSPFLKLGQGGPAPPTANDDEQRAHDAVREARAALLSAGGDALTLLNVFEAWLAVKAGPGGGASTRWCRRHGLAEARLYEMAKLRAQFAELLADAGILRAGGRTALSAGGSQRRGRAQRRRRAGGLQGAELHAAKRKLREMQAERERERGRKVLKAHHAQKEAGGRHSRGGDGDGGGAGSGSATSSGSDGSGDELEQLHDLDLRVSVDVRAMAQDASSPLSPSDAGLLRLLLALALYPRVAVADDANGQRREQDCRFNTAQVSDLVVHPGSVLSGHASELPRGQVLLFQELIETRRHFLSGLTPLWALPSLLLAAQRLDCDAAASRWLVDGWLLLRLHDGSGLQVLALLLELRGGCARLLSRRLRAARLSALAGVATADEEEAAAGGQGDGGEEDVLGELLRADGAAAPAPAPGLTPAIQQRYTALAVALPEEVRPALRAVMVQRQQDQEERAAREQQRQRRLQDQAAPGDGIAKEQRPQQGPGGEGDDEPGSIAAALDAELEDELARQLALDAWPTTCSLERLPPGAKVTAQFDLAQALQQRLEQQQQQPAGDGGDGAAGPLPPPGPSNGGGGGIATDPLGVPLLAGGRRLAPWLRYGSLRSFESTMALHALQPALRRAWQCPGCNTRLLGTFQQVQDHIEGCSATRGLDPQQLEVGGYSLAAASAPAGATAGAASTAAGSTGGADEQQREGGAGAEGEEPAGGAGEEVSEPDGRPAAARGSQAPDYGGSSSRRAGARALERYMEQAAVWSRRRPAGGHGGVKQQLQLSAEAVAAARLGLPAAFGSAGAGHGAGAAAAHAPAHGHGAHGHGVHGPGPAGQQQQLQQQMALGQRHAPAGKSAAAASWQLDTPSAGGAGLGQGAAGGGGRPFSCEVCGFSGLLTPPQALQHRRSHQAAAASTGAGGDV